MMAPMDRTSLEVDKDRSRTAGSQNRSENRSTEKKTETI